MHVFVFILLITWCLQHVLVLYSSKPVCHIFDKHYWITDFQQDVPTANQPTH